MNRQNKFVLAVFLIIFITLFRLFLFHPHVSTDLHHLYGEGLKSNLILPPAYRDFFTGDGLGQRYIFNLSSWFIHPVFAALGYLGVGFTEQMIFIIFVPMLILGILGIRKLVRNLGISDYGFIAASMFYLLNTYFILLVDGGQITIALNYVLTPFLIYHAFVYFEKGSNVNLMYSLVILLLMSVFDVRIFLQILIIYFIFLVLNIREYRFTIIKRYVIYGVLSGFLIIFYHSYWILPTIVMRGEVFPSGFASSSDLDFLNSYSQLHVLFASSPNWYKNIFGQLVLPLWYLFIIPIVVFLPVLRKPKNKNVVLWLLIAMTGIYLAKGVNPPLGRVYIFLFENIPGFGFFRDSSKFMLLVALAYSILLGYSFDILASVLSKNNLILKKKHLLIIFSALLIITVTPVFLGKMTGVISRPSNEKEYYTVAEVLSTDLNFGRTVWIPSVSPLGFSSTTHPSVSMKTLIDKRPFAAGIVGTYETNNFLRDAPHTGELLDISGIKYLAYPFPDYRRTELKTDNIEYYDYFSTQLKELPWIDNELFGPPVRFFSTKSSQDRFFIAPNSFVIVGSDRIYWDLMKIPNFKLAKNVLMFAEETPNSLLNFKDEIGFFNNSKVVLFHKDEIDLKMSLVNHKNFYFPSDDLSQNPDDTGWWKRDSESLIEWRAFLQEKYGIDTLDYDYGGGWSVAEGEKRKVFSSDKFKVGDRIYVRAMESTKSGEIQAYQDGRIIGSVTTKIEEPLPARLVVHGSGNVEDVVYDFEDGIFKWFEIGILTSGGKIEIETKGDINVVQSIISVSAGELEDIESTFKEIDKENVLTWDKLSEAQKLELFSSEENPKVEYEGLTPTNYKVYVSNLDKPATLVFASNFDEYWVMNDQESKKVYSLLNGFELTHNGTYEIQFSPQYYVDLGLKISLSVFLFTFVLYLGIYIVRNK